MVQSDSLSSIASSTPAQASSSEPILLGTPVMGSGSSPRK